MFASGVESEMDRNNARTTGNFTAFIELWHVSALKRLCGWAAHWLCAGFQPNFLITIHDSVSNHPNASSFLTPHLLASLGIPLSPINPDAILIASYEDRALPSLLLTMILDNWEFSVFSSEGRQRVFRHDRDDMVWVESAFPEAVEEARKAFEEMDRVVKRAASRS